MEFFVTQFACQNTTHKNLEKRKIKKKIETKKCGEYSTNESAGDRQIFHFWSLSFTHNSSVNMILMTYKKMEEKKLRPKTTHPTHKCQRTQIIKQVLNHVCKPCNRIEKQKEKKSTQKTNKTISSMDKFIICCTD